MVFKPLLKDKTEENESELNINMKMFDDLKLSVFFALQNYSNIHRGSGHKSMITTHLYELSRKLILDYLELPARKYDVVFCTMRRAVKLTRRLKEGSFISISSADIGLGLGVWAIAVKKRMLGKLQPVESGGGTTRLISADWVVWAKSPGRFEAGTPAVINIIAFARALQILKQYGKSSFICDTGNSFSARELLYNGDLEHVEGRELLAELKSRLIGHDVVVPTARGPVQFINFDNAASTPAFTDAWEVAWRTCLAPRNFDHEIVDEVRNICSGFLGADRANYDFIFTSNTTEAINLVAENIGSAGNPDHGQVIINTILEHNSNDLPWRLMPGGKLIRIFADNNGLIELPRLEELLIEYNQDCAHADDRVVLVALSGASNVLGTCNDLPAISKLVHKYGAKILVDAAQLVAHRKMDIDTCGIDYLVFSAHKIYAPFGTGVLVARKGLLNFSTEESDLIRSSGEANPGGIAALGKSLVLLKKIGMNVIQEEEQALTRKAVLSLLELDGVTVHGICDPDAEMFTRRGGVISFTFKKIFSFTIAEKLADSGGIGIRFGCHCAHLLVKWILKVSPGLEKFQRVIVTLFSNVSLPGVSRISLGIGNTAKEVEFFIALLHEISEMKTGGKMTGHPAGMEEPDKISRGELKKLMNDYRSSVISAVFPDQVLSN